MKKKSYIEKMLKVAGFTIPVGEVRPKHIYNFPEKKIPKITIDLDDVRLLGFEVGHLRVNGIKYKTIKSK